MTADERGWVPFHLRVGAILRGTDLEVFTANARRLHEAFYGIAQDNPDLLPGMTFSRPLSYPYSHDLASALFRLQQGDAISADNPKWVRYRVQKQELDRKLEDVDARERDTVRRLREAGQRLAEAISLTEEEEAGAPVASTRGRAGYAEARR